MAATFNLVLFETSFHSRRDPTGSTMQMKTTENYCCNGIHVKPKKELLLQKHETTGGRHNKRALGDYFETAEIDLPTSSNVVQLRGLTPANSPENKAFQQTSGQQETISVIRTPSHTRGTVYSQCPIQNAAL